MSIRRLILGKRMNKKFIAMVMFYTLLALFIIFYCLSVIALIKADLRFQETFDINKINKLQQNIVKLNGRTFIFCFVRKQSGEDHKKLGFTSNIEMDIYQSMTMNNKKQIIEFRYPRKLNDYTCLWMKDFDESTYYVPHLTFLEKIGRYLYSYMRICDYIKLVQFLKAHSSYFVNKKALIFHISGKHLHFESFDFQSGQKNYIYCQTLHEPKNGIILPVPVETLCMFLSRHASDEI